MAKKLKKAKEKIVAKTIDIWFLAVSFVLVVWGVATVGMVSFPLSLEYYSTPWHYFFQQLIRLGIGVILAFVAFRVPLEKLKKYALPLLLINLGILFLVFLPVIGGKSGGAHRWLRLGWFSLQPSEFLKITFLFYLSAWLGSKKSKDKKLFLFFIAILAVVVLGLLPQKDLSTLAVIALSALAVFFVKKTAIWQVIALVVLAIVFFGTFVAIEPYRIERIKTVFKPLQDPFGASWQFQQAQIAIGSGKLLGVGEGLSLGMSRQKFGFLPEATTDSIFAIVAEELGFFGAVLLIACFLFFLWRALKISWNTRNEFQKYLACGIAVWITSQGLLNIGGISGIIPLGGIPLPFFSYGGSHLIAELIGVGLILNISKNTN